MMVQRCFFYCVCVSLCALTHGFGAAAAAGVPGKSEERSMDMDAAVKAFGTNERAFLQALTSFGSGFVTFLGCMDRLKESGRRKARELLRTDETCSSLMNSLTAVPLIAEEETAYQVLTEHYNKLLQIHSGSPASTFSHPSAVSKVLQEFNRDVERLLSSVADELLTGEEHEYMKRLARTMSPLLLHSLYLGWRAASGLSPSKPSRHHKRLAMALRNLWSVDECLHKVAMVFVGEKTSYAMRGYFATPELTQRELSLSALPLHMLLHPTPLPEATPAQPAAAAETEQDQMMQQ